MSNGNASNRRRVALRRLARAKVGFSKQAWRHEACMLLCGRLARPPFWFGDVRICRRCKTVADRILATPRRAP